MQARLGLALVLSLAACGRHTGDGNGTDGNSGDSGALGPDAFAGPWTDFPGTPVIDPSAPPGAAGLFGSASVGGAAAGPCLVEPEVGTLYPQNWLRPRFSWMPSAGENLFELTLMAANETQPLIVYTAASTWTMDAATWQLLASHIVDQPITVMVRGAVYDSGTMALTAGPSVGTAGNIAIAPSMAPGAIVYRTTTGGTRLRGFHIGDESVTEIVTPDDASTACVGCHSSSPDGMYVGFSASADAGNGDPAAVNLLSADGNHTAPPFLTASASALMARTYQESPVFSTSHWQDGDHTAVAMTLIDNTGAETNSESGTSQMIWVDLEATSQAVGTGWGVIGRGSETSGAAEATFARTTDTLLYATGAGSVGAGITVLHGDLETIPFNNRMGGTATPVAGANTSTYNEYYPAFSSDDHLIAFNRVADGQTSYNDGAAEVYVIPAGGGTPTRLAANDPPTCSGLASPGLTNSWPKWSPGTTDVGTKRYYWLTFSSTRTAAANSAALRHAGRRRRRRHADDLPRAVSVEPTVDGEQSHAGVGQLRRADRAALLAASSRGVSGCAVGARGVARDRGDQRRPQRIGKIVAHAGDRQPRRARDQARERAAGGEREHRILRAVDHQRRHADLGQARAAIAGREHGGELAQEPARRCTARMGGGTERAAAERRAPRLAATPGCR